MSWWCFWRKFEKSLKSDFFLKNRKWSFRHEGVLKNQIGLKKKHIFEHFQKYIFLYFENFEKHFFIISGKWIRWGESSRTSRHTKCILCNDYILRDRSLCICISVRSKFKIVIGRVEYFIFRCCNKCFKRSVDTQCRV